ncbi:MAG TPA: LuxR C-terminal-related transcriptional regulator [Caulobacteraceae bacterium]|nr:LuxR C-terminal-related transcriptional regulator [Caulobacteraceae bacterium]
MGKISRAGDWIAVLEAVYALDGDDRAWMDGLLACIGREHWPGQTSVGFTFDLSPTGIDVGEVRLHGRPEVLGAVLATTASMSNAGIDVLFRPGRVVTTMSETLGQLPSEDGAMFRSATAESVPDVLGVIVHSGGGRGAVVSLVLDAPRASTVAERRDWTRCAAHVGAGLRLRAVSPELESFDAAPIEAIFDGGGKCHHAQEAASSNAARERLRHAVRLVDRARTRAGRQDSIAAMAEWEGLVSGRWSLIDRFDSDDRRFVVAVRNDPRFPDPRGLSLRERQVAEFAGVGRSAKEIGYLLGVAAPSVENSLRRAQAKLGLRSRLELTDFFSPQGVRSNLARVALSDTDVLIGAAPRLDETRISGLTTAEREVLALLIAGSTNADIGRRRGTSPNTVAKQVQAIFRAFGARSRGELLARLNEQYRHASVGS